MSPRRPSAADIDPVVPRTRTPDAFVQLEVSSIQANDWNPRRSVDPARQAELEASVREKGIIEPLIVRPIADALGRYEVVAGSRRLTAAKAVGLERTFCVVKDLSDQDALEHALIENLVRHDMHPLDEAEAYGALIKADKRVYTVAKIAARVGQSESHVYRRVRLLDLEPDLRAALAEDRLSLGHAEKLLRLDPKRRKEAAHAENGVVWRRSPLLDYDEKWIPSKDDLRPLAELEHFIRTRTHFDPLSADARHFQPTLAAQLDAAAEDDGATERAWAGDDDQDEALDSAISQFVRLSEDPMARSKMGASKSEDIPLTPSKWREVKSEKARCEYTIKGVVTHGGPPRVIDVCTKRTCPKHFPVSRKPKTSASAREAKTQQDYVAKQRAEEARRQAERQRFDALVVKFKPAAAAATKGTKFSAAVVRSVLSAHELGIVKREYGVDLTESTAAQVLLLGTIGNIWSRTDLAGHAKAFRINLKKLEGEVQREVAAVAKAAAAPQKKAAHS